MNSVIDHSNGTSTMENANGDKQWFLNGKLHRDDGPAAEWADGTMQWWVNGNFHGAFGPPIDRTGEYSYINL